MLFFGRFAAVSLLDLTGTAFGDEIETDWFGRLRTLMLFWGGLVLNEIRAGSVYIGTVNEVSIRAE